MSQQASDVPRFVQILGRYQALIGIMVLLGLLGGAVFAALNPPTFTSQALVVFPASSCPAGAICGGPMFAPNRPVSLRATLLKSLPSGVQLKPIAANGLLVSTTAGTAAQAEAATDAAARTYLAYAESLSYPGEQVPAYIQEPTTRATGTPPLIRLREDLLLGAVFGALLGIVAALAGSGSTIDTLTAPPGYNIGDEKNPEARYASTGLSLRQTALDDAAPDRSEA
jgi:hypothetical protein